MTWALTYARYGWSVIPVHSVVAGRCTCRRTECPSPAKHPSIRWEPAMDHPATPKHIAAWWKRWPDANVGIVTGTVSCLAVVDVGQRDGQCCRLERRCRGKNEVHRARLGEGDRDAGYRGVGLGQLRIVEQQAADHPRGDGGRDGHDLGAQVGRGAAPLEGQRGAVLGALDVAAVPSRAVRWVETGTVTGALGLVLLLPAIAAVLAALLGAPLAALVLIKETAWADRPLFEVAPFGGYRQSGNGREWGAHGFTDYLEIKALEG